MAKTTYGLPCGNDRCPLCKPAMLADIPASSVIRMPKADAKRRIERQYFAGTRQACMVGQTEKEFGDWDQMM